MRRRTRASRALFALTVVSLLTLTTACGSSSSDEQQPTSTAGVGGTQPAQTGNSASAASEIPDGPIKIGAIAELSGAGAGIGNYVAGVQKALVKYFNEHGGIAGHQIELVLENNQSDAATATAAARKLIKEGVAATVFTGLGTSGKDQALAILAQAKIISVDPDPVDKFDNGKEFPYYFTDNVIDPNAMVALAGFAKDKGLDQIGQLGDSTPFSKSLEENFAKRAGEKGLTIVKTVNYPTTATTMTTQLSQLKDAGVQTLALWCQSGCGKVFDGLHQINWAPKILTTQSLYYGALASVKDLGPTTFADCPISLDAGQKLDETAADIIKYVAAATGGGGITNMGIPLNADSWMIIKYAIEKAQSLDGDKLKAAIESIQDQSFSMPNVKYTFTAEHHAGFQASNPQDIGVCTLDQSALGELDLPVRVN